MQMDRVLAVGGDEGINRKSGPAKANRFEPVVRCIGPFFLPAGKTRTHNIRLPQYVGSVRVMVVAGLNGAYGSQEKSVPVRKPLMLLATLPRVLGPGESLKMPVNIFAMEQQVKDVTVTVETNDLIQVGGENEKQLKFTQPGDEMVTYEMKMKEKVGVGKVHIEARSGKEHASVDVEVEVRNPNPYITDIFEGVADPGSQWSTSFKPVGMPGTNSVMLEVSALPSLNLDKRLVYLMRYPYGCIEQTVSAVFPQLFLGRLIDLDIVKTSQVETNIRNAIQRIRTFQTSEGGLSYWPGETSPNEWGTSYAGHFMLEAQSAGFSLPVNFIAEWKRYQRNRALTWQRKGFQSDLDQAYRLYTLALARAPELGAMNRLKESGELSLQARWRLAAAYALVGQKEAALEMVNNMAVAVKAYRSLGGTFGSQERDEAMILETLTLLDIRTTGMQVVQNLARVLGSEGWMSTQATAFSLMAVAKFCGTLPRGTGMNFTYSSGTSTGVEYNTTARYAQIPFRLKDIQGGSVKLINRGKQLLFARLIVHGQPATGDATSASNNLGIDIRYYTKEGTILDPSAVEQGTDFIAEYTITNPGKLGHYEQMALSTIYHSGWEIHNARMDNTEGVAESSPMRYQNILDDRVYTFFDLAPSRKNVYRIRLNASYLGKFYLPSVTCEAMYNAAISARHPGQWVNVVPARKGGKVASR
jgi:uncharacterized protein YfaS (alpha-2-macroglobulin family)